MESRATGSDHVVLKENPQQLATLSLPSTGKLVVFERPAARTKLAFLVRGFFFFEEQMVFRIVTVWRHSAILEVPEGITFVTPLFLEPLAKKQSSFSGAKSLVKKANGTLYLHHSFTQRRKKKIQDCMFNWVWDVSFSTQNHRAGRNQQVWSDCLEA